MVERAYSVTPVHLSVRLRKGPALAICIYVFQAGAYVSFDFLVLML